MADIYQDPRSYVTPGVFSQEALAYKRQQESLGRHVLTKAYEKMPGAECNNCQDHTVLIVTPLASGPHKTFPSRKTAVWFEGDEKSGPGWYVVHRTKKESIGPDGKKRIVWRGSINFACPVCQDAVVEDPDDNLPDYANW